MRRECARLMPRATNPGYVSRVFRKRASKDSRSRHRTSSSVIALVRRRCRLQMTQLVGIAHHVQRSNHVALNLERGRLHGSLAAVHDDTRQAVDGRKAHPEVLAPPRTGTFARGVNAEVSMSRQIRVVVVMRNARGSDTLSRSDACQRKYVSCTASSASAIDPSMRYARPSRRRRYGSKLAAGFDIVLAEVTVRAAVRRCGASGPEPARRRPCRSAPPPWPRPLQLSRCPCRDHRRQWPRPAHL